VRRVAVTGLGLITPLGRGVEVNWSAVEAGRIGLRDAPENGRPAWMWCLGRVEDAALEPGIPDSALGQARFLNRGALLGVCAAQEAVRQAAIPASVPPARRALYLATGDYTKLGYDFLYPATRAATKEGRDVLDLVALNRAAIEQVNPFFLLESLHNNPFSFLAAAFELMGPGTTLASQSPSGSNAVELAFRTVRAGRADVVVAVGCGSWVTEVALFELAGLGLLSRARLGIRSYRPFDRRRDGFLAGEGGAAVVLEDELHARARGVKILAMVEGVGNSTEPSLRLAVPKLVTLRAMELALADAGRSASDLGLVCTHGSGTRKGDRSELASLHALLGEFSSAVPICALKPYTGHMGAASDVAEVALGIIAASRHVAPGTPNFVGAEPPFAGLRIAASPQPCTRPLLLAASYGVGGQASALVVEATPENVADRGAGSP
jgi:3-oxoacyl-[acyl-carrier-protein] synthase II